MEKLTLFLIIIFTACNEPKVNQLAYTEKEREEDSIRNKIREENESRLILLETKYFNPKVRDAIFYYRVSKNIKCWDGEFTFSGFSFFVGGGRKWFKMDKPESLELSKEEADYLWQIYSDCNKYLKPNSYR